MDQEMVQPFCEAKRWSLKRQRPVADKFQEHILQYVSKSESTSNLTEQVWHMDLGGSLPAFKFQYIKTDLKLESNFLSSLSFLMIFIAIFHNLRILDNTKISF